MITPVDRHMDRILILYTNRPTPKITRRYKEKVSKIKHGEHFPPRKVAVELEQYSAFQRSFS